MRTKQTLFPPDYVVVDIETTGLKADTDAIIEIGAVKVRNHEIVEQFSELINPYRMISPFITKLTGISNEMVEHCDGIEVILTQFLDFAQEDIILGHNVSFDLGFLINKCSRLGVSELTNQKMDTLSMARKKLPFLPHHRLGDLVSFFEIPQPTAHRALADCLSTKAVYDHLRQMEEKEKPSSTHPFTNKRILISGKLTGISKNEALARLLALEGIIEKSLTTKTDILVLANLKEIQFIEPLTLGYHPFLIISEAEFIQTLSKKF